MINSGFHLGKAFKTELVSAESEFTVVTFSASYSFLDFQVNAMFAPSVTLVLLASVFSPLAAAGSTIYTGYPPKCQACLDGAVSLCASSRNVNNCICLGDGYEEAVDVCMGRGGICEKESPGTAAGQIGDRWLDQWTQYCMVVQGTSSQMPTPTRYVECALTITASLIVKVR